MKQMVLSSSLITHISITMSIRHCINDQQFFFIYRIQFNLFLLTTPEKKIGISYHNNDTIETWISSFLKIES